MKHRLASAVEWVMAVLALAVVPVLVLEERTTNEITRATAVAANWGIWLAFCGEYSFQLWRAPQKRTYVRRAWFDLAIIALSPPFLVPPSLQGARALRALRLLRLLRGLSIALLGLRLLRRLLGPRNFHYVLAVAAAIVGLGALGIYVLERGVTVNSLGDAAWWAVVTATTVGYGDVSPKTAEGRLLAVALMMVGIGVIGIFTATVASLFFRQEQDTEMTRLMERLEALEAKVDQLLAAIAIHSDRPGNR